MQLVLDPAGGFDPNYALYKSSKYTSFAAPVVLASGVEARLIEAEAALAAEGIPYEGKFPRPDGAYQIFISDPDGYSIEFCQVAS